MSLDHTAAGDVIANQPITISSSPTLPSPSEFLSKRNAVRSASVTLQENAGVSNHIHDKSMSSHDVGERPRVPFNELVGNFGYSRRTMSPTTRANTGEALTKRRRVELQDQKVLAPVRRKATADMPPPAKPVKRARSPKKKVQTITALATAAYLPKVTSEDAAEAEPVTHGPLAKKARKPAKAAAVDSEKPKKARKPRTKPADGVGTAKSKQAARAKAPKKAKGKEAVPRQELYTPQRATEQMHKQDFFFGTSSQLAAPESPSFIRQMQVAMDESELSLLSCQALEAAKHESYFRVPSAPHGTNLSVAQGSKELWCNAARDLKGGVARNISTVSKSNAPARKTPSPAKRVTVNTTSPRSDGIAPATAISPQTVPFKTFINSEADSSGYIDIDSYTSSRPPQSMYRVKDALPESTPGRTTLSSHTTKMVHSAQPSTAKAVSKMVDLADVPPSTQAVRPKKTKSTTTREKEAGLSTPSKQPTFAPMEQISDDEVLASPSPPRVRGGVSTATIKPLTLSPARSRSRSPTKASPTSKTSIVLSATASIKATDEQWPNIARILFPRITAAVKAPPHSTGLEDITWHEKILLYDPIILEDFTAWLNERGITINVTRMRRKTTTKTKTEKKRQDKDSEQSEEVVTGPTSETEVAQETLQCWMVQKWCEEHSICCCSKDTYRGAARAKY